MELKAYAVHDGKGKYFGLPFFMQNAGMATRAFSDLVNDPQSSINRHPEDYVLYEIGKYDDQTAILEPKTPLELIATANQFKTQPEVIKNWRLPPKETIEVSNNHKEENVEVK
jgi:hypothetical protein